jgi:REP element-mobilizing transposase RayT
MLRSSNDRQRCEGASDGQAFSSTRYRGASCAHSLRTLGGQRSARVGFQPLGPIHFGRNPNREQPTRQELRAFHVEHREFLNFPIFWIDDRKRQETAQAIGDLIGAQGYTCYACAICANHVHLIIRTHKHDSLTMWNHFAESVRNRLRLRFPNEICANHPVISARPCKVFLYNPDQVRDFIDYVEQNPLREQLLPQRWAFVSAYDGFPFHKKR